MSDYPEDLKYTAEHEWVRSGNGATVRVGITEYAADQLGDIVFVSLPAVGEEVSAGDACGELESTKSVSDIFCPVSGVVSAVKRCWRPTPRPSTPTRTVTVGCSSSRSAPSADLDDLLDADAYAEQVGRLAGEACTLAARTSAWQGACSPRIGPRLSTRRRDRRGRMKSDHAVLHELRPRQP